jgi:hypothetical protein
MTKQVPGCWTLLWLVCGLLISGCSENPAIEQPPAPGASPPASTQPAQTRPRPTVKEAKNPVQANLPPGDPRHWAPGSKYQPPPVAPLTEQETRLQSQVAQVGGRFAKRALTDEERRVNTELGIQFAGDAVVTVDLDRMKSAGKLASLESLDGVLELGLSRSDVNDLDLQQLARANDLIALDLNFTQVTDAGLVHLEGLKNLRFLVVENTGVTAQGVQRLKQANPRLRIFHSSTQGENSE